MGYGGSSAGATGAPIMRLSLANRGCNLVLNSIVVRAVNGYGGTSNTS